MRPPPRGAVTGIILAGGQGRRMGADKARLRWRGRSLLQHWQTALANQTAEIVIVQARPRTPARQCAAAWDRHPGQGPVRGIEAGLRRARRRWCLIVPVDSLPPPQPMVPRLARAGGGYLQRGPDHCYLHLLVRRERRHALAAFLSENGRAAANACAVMGLSAVPIAPAALPVASLNTRTEWRALLRRRKVRA